MILMNHRITVRVAAVLSVALAFADVQAHAADADLVKDAVELSKRVSVAGPRPTWIRAERARGTVDADLRLENVNVLLNRTPERQAAFEALLREQQDPDSPRFHQWLDATQIGERYGASAHDLDALSDWLRSEGLRVEGVSPARTRVRISGRSADVARAFDTALAWYDGDGGRRIGAKSAPRVPAAFAAAVRGVVGLDTVVFRPGHRMSAPRAGAITAGGPAPAGTSCGADGCEHIVFPADFARIYGLDTPPASNVGGSGVSIAIVGRERVYPPDISNFQSILYRTPPRVAQVIVPPGSLDPGDPASTCSTTGGTPSCTDPGDEIGDQYEATLDVQLAIATAPSADIKLVVAADSDTRNGVQEAIEYVIDTSPPPANILSISFLSCEPANGAAIAHYLDDLFAQAAAEGISVLVASGDAGAAGCEDHTAPPTANQSRAINVLCASGYVTCVGGTQFADTADPSRYWSDTDGNGYLSARGYIPEGAWNEPVARDGSSSHGATGGGTSLYIPKPAWQTGVGVPANAWRNTPDIALTASSHDGYFTCMAAQRGPCTVSGGHFSFLVSSGTSASTPAMAGIVARLNENYSGGQGNLNPRLYALASHPSYAVFHDVTVGSSGVASCDLAVPSLCNNSTPGPTGPGGGLKGYAVTDGYDLATGLGSVAANYLMANWGGAQPPGVVLNQHGISGSWAEPNAQAQGILLTVQPDFYAPGSGLLFGGWFTYGAEAGDGARWYTIQGEVAGTSAILPLYQTVGGRLHTLQTTTTTPAGVATLSFYDCTHGTLQYTAAGYSGTLSLTRLLPNVTCAMNGNNGVSAGHYLLSGVWADVAADNGQGLVLDLNPAQHVLFGAWYTYAADAPAGADASTQRWYTLQATLPSGNRISAIPLYESRGGTFVGQTPATTTAVGTADLTFHSCTSATLAYAFDPGTNGGQHGTLELSRLTPAPSGCHL
jgi:subtilase family serine protease